MQHVDRDAKGVEVKTDVDVMTDADCITMDDGDLRSGVKKMIDDRIGEVIDGAPEQLDTLKEIATELEKNQSGVSTILKKLEAKIDKSQITDDLSVRSNKIVLSSSAVAEALDTFDSYVNTRINEKVDKTEIKTKLSEMIDDETHRTVTDEEKKEMER